MHLGYYRMVGRHDKVFSATSGFPDGVSLGGGQHVSTRGSCWPLLSAVLRWQAGTAEGGTER